MRIKVNCVISLTNRVHVFRQKLNYATAYNCVTFCRVGFLFFLFIWGQTHLIKIIADDLMCQFILEVCFCFIFFKKFVSYFLSMSIFLSIFSLIHWRQNRTTNLKLYFWAGFVDYENLLNTKQLKLFSD
jgi:hypothetical protein